jgi:hypothetical protein
VTVKSMRALIPLAGYDQSLAKIPRSETLPLLRAHTTASRTLATLRCQAQRATEQWTVRRGPWERFAIEPPVVDGLGVLYAARDDVRRRAR